jgi:hypothetical protein
MGSFMPRTDLGLEAFANPFSGYVTTNAVVLGVPAGTATDLATKTTDYSDALHACDDPVTRTRGKIAAKNTARTILRKAIGDVALLIYGNPNVTDEQLRDMNLTVRSAPTYQPPPALAPIIAAKSISGRTVRGTLRDATVEDKRRRPINAKGATMMIAWGTPTPPPAGDAGWRLAGQTGRTSFVVQFPNEVAGGVPCYISALWYNERGEYSPASDPITVYLSAPAAGAA